jgi:aerobic carbon-monoxide dehydrogenase small subunit
MESISLKVNGTSYTFEVDKSMTLLDILRDRLNLTGSKLACGYGKCGCCTVVMNGLATRSCVTKALKANGADVLTIEGLEEGLALHPIQKAFIEAGAVQCGFFTPGIIMTLYALFTGNPRASSDEIREELNGHLCRCTGYENIVKGALLAQERMASVKSR